MLKLRERFVHYKQGYSQIASLLGGSTFALSLSSFLKLYLPAAENAVLFSIVGVVGGVVVYCFMRFGDWDYGSERSFYKKQVEVEITHNPYTQSYIRLMLRICDKVGVPPGDYADWLNEEVIKQGDE